MLIGRGKGNLTDLMKNTVTVGPEVLLES